MLRARGAAEGGERAHALLAAATDLAGELSLDGLRTMIAAARERWLHPTS